MDAELHHLDGVCAGQTQVVRKEFATIGRHPSADVRFDADRDLDVSGRHAALFREGGGWVLRDLGSTNGTWVNGERLKGDRVLAPHDVIRFGPQGPQLVFQPRQVDAATVPLTAAAPPEGPRNRVILPAGSTTERIRVEVRRQTTPWRRATFGLAAFAIVGVLGVALVARQRSRALETERLALLARIDNLIERLEVTSSNVSVLAGALQQAKRETERLRGSLATRGVSSQRLDSLSRQVASSVRQHEAVLQAAQLDGAAIGRANRDAVGLVLSEFPDGHRVAGTGFAVRVRGDTGWVVTSRHLVSDPVGTRARRLGVIFNGSNQNFRAELAATADSADLALLRVRVRGGIPVVRGLGGNPRPGDPVAILGFPYGLDFPTGLDWRRVGVSVSTFAGTIRQVRDDALELDAYGASGSSGSPVFNAAGEVAGVIYGGDPATAGRIVYAVPVAQLQGLLRKALAK